MQRLIKALLSGVLLIWLLGILYFLADLIMGSLKYNTVSVFILAALAVIVLVVLVCLYMFSLLEESRFEKLLETANQHISRKEFSEARDACLKAQELESEEEDSLMVLEMLAKIYKETEDGENLKQVRRRIKALKGKLEIETEANP